VKVVVVGAGIAGTAAAWVAARAGARVTLVNAGSGASSLSTGGLDFEASGSQDARGLGTSAAEVLRALGSVVVPDGRPVLLATTAGLVRPARGHDAALLDWTPFAGKRVGVVRARRPGWDADALARSWRGQHGVDATALDATALRHSDERVLPDADFAARHDDEARLGWLAERLRQALARGPAVHALVLPPSLGVEHARGAALSTLVELPCGEAATGPGGPSGLRFQHARDRALKSQGVERLAGRVVAVNQATSGWQLQLEGGARVEADAVVLATGGLLGGGIEYAPSEWLPGSEVPGAASVPFRFGLACDGLELGAHGRAMVPPGSLFGMPPEKLAWPFAADPIMDRVGALADADGRVPGYEGLFVAGEMAADVPHAWLAVLESGASAGHAATASASRAPEGSLQRSPGRDAYPSRPASRGPHAG
jgi:glycerol-3-phosphate dehydrogenase subunit B